MLRSLLLAIVITTSIANAGEMDPAPWNFRVLYDLSTMTDKTQFSHALAVGLQKAGVTEELQHLVESTVAVNIEDQLEQMIHETFLELPESVQRNRSNKLVGVVDGIEKNKPQLYKKLMHILMRTVNKILERHHEDAVYVIITMRKYLAKGTPEQKQSGEELLKAFGLTEDELHLGFKDILNAASFHEMAAAIAKRAQKAPSMARLKELLCKAGLSEDDTAAVTEKLKYYTRENAPSLFFYIRRMTRHAAWIYFSDFDFRWTDMEYLIRWYLTLAYRPWKTIHGQEVVKLRKEYIRLLRLTSKDMFDSFFRKLENNPDYIQDKMTLLHKKIQDSGEKLAVLGLDVTQQSFAHYKEIPQEIKDRAAFIFKPGNVYASLNTMKHFAFNPYIPKDNNKRQAVLKSVLEVAESLRRNIGDKSADNVVRLAKTLLGDGRFC